MQEANDIKRKVSASILSVAGALADGKPAHGIQREREIYRKALGQKYLAVATSGKRRVIRR